MDKPSSPPTPPTQSIQAGGNATQVGGNWIQTQTKTTNFNFVFWIVGIVALGGLAWGVYMGKVNQPRMEQPQISPSNLVEPRAHS